MPNKLTPLQQKQSKYLGIAIDYILGKTYSEIRRIYGCNNGYIQYALAKMGVDTNRIKSSPRFNNHKRRKFSKELKAIMRDNAKVNKRYDDRERHLHCTMGKQADNNPVHILDDLDIMEQMNGIDGVDDFINDGNLRYEIVITKDDNFEYVKGGES